MACSTSVDHFRAGQLALMRGLDRAQLQSLNRFSLVIVPETTGALQKQARRDKGVRAWSWTCSWLPPPSPCPAAHLCRSRCHDVTLTIAMTKVCKGWSHSLDNRLRMRIIARDSLSWPLSPSSHWLRALKLHTSNLVFIRLPGWPSGTTGALAVMGPAPPYVTCTDIVCRVPVALPLASGSTSRGLHGSGFSAAAAVASVVVGEPVSLTASSTTLTHVHPLFF
jgi:hypothetical protein